VSRVLVVDVGGSHVKVLASDEPEPRRADSGPDLTAAQMVDSAKKLAADWAWDRVSVGVPSPVHGGRVVAEPVNLGEGWVGFDYTGAFGRRQRERIHRRLPSLGPRRACANPGLVVERCSLESHSPQTALEAGTPVGRARSHRRSPQSMHRGSTCRTITALPQAAQRNHPLVATPAGQNST